MTQPVNWRDGDIPGQVECLTCGYVDPTEQGACPRCGKALPQRAIHPPTPPRPRGAADAAVERITLILPATPRVQRWYRATQDLAKELTAEADRADELVRSQQETAQQARRAGAAFTRLLEQVSVAEQPSGRKLTADQRVLPPGAWSLGAAACMKCGTTERKHLARGLCTRCYRPIEKPSEES